MNEGPQITAAKLKSVLRYDPETGCFWWLRSGKGRYMNKPAGKLGAPPKDYVAITIDGSRYYAHRLAWLYTHEAMPTEQIDHINGIKSDNRIANLREATSFQNQANRSSQANNSTGLKGVTKHLGKYWKVQIQIRGKGIHLGLFPSAESAHAAYLAAAREAFGDFSNAGNSRDA